MNNRGVRQDVINELREKAKRGELALNDLKAITGHENPDGGMASPDAVMLTNPKEPEELVGQGRPGSLDTVSGVW